MAKKTKAVTLFDVYDGWADSSNGGFPSDGSSHEALAENAYDYGNGDWFDGGISRKQADFLASCYEEAERDALSQEKLAKLKDTVVGKHYSEEYWNRFGPQAR